MKAISALVLAFALTPAYFAEGAIKVVASNLPVYIFALNVASGRADVSLLVPPGTDIHDYALRPSDVKRLNAADLILLSGAGLEAKITGGIRNKDRIVDTSSGIRLLRAGEISDPHIWLDPVIASAQVKNIRDALALKDTMNAAHYIESAEAYIKKLNSLSEEMDKILSPFKGETLITYHEAFNYFSARFGLRAYAIAGTEPEFLLPRRLKEVYDIARRNKAKAVFVEKQFPEDSIKRLGRDLKVRVCVLDSLESGRPEAGYYEEAMRQNASTVARCLSGK